jgi:hypothetical protein
MHWIGLAFYIVTGLASIAGAILSWKAWRTAISARTAAREAKRAVRSSNAAEELRELNRLASELLDFIQNDRLQPAAVRARDLFSQVSTARMRWQRFLDDDDALEGAQDKARKISLGIVGIDGQTGPEVKQKLLTYCHAIRSSGI